MDIGIRADGLSTDEFEQFAVELIKRKFEKENFHGFKEGRDDGIDGVDDIKNPSIVLQAKRWCDDKNKKTAVRLLKEEIDKICITKKNLKYNWTNPFSYVIVTSMGLLPSQLKEIRDYADEKCGSLIPSDDYIIHGSVLNELSNESKYSDIFEDHGLLIKNIGKILHKEKIKTLKYESGDYFSDIDFDYFVETKFLGEAYRILQNERILLIQGPAGIGKSTTCKALGNLFLNNSEDVEIIERKVKNIDEIIDLFNREYRDTSIYSGILFVVLDDFLGKNSYDKEDEDLAEIQKLYSVVKNSDRLILCLNSRTQILQTAKESEDEFQSFIDSKLKHKNFVLDLSKYSTLEKAHLLRKTFEKKINELEEGKKIELSSNYSTLKGKWEGIVNHRSFYPRLINFVVENYDQSEEDFYDYIISNLNRPNKLYDKLFARLKDEEKYLLFVLYFFNELPAKEKWLSNQLNKVVNNSAFNFTSSLNRLNESWVHFVRLGVTDEDRIDFFNPSIVDYLKAKIQEYPMMEENIFENAIYINLHLKKYINNYRVRDDFFQKLLTSWDSFLDREEYIGERLVSLIKKCDYHDYTDEFSKHINSYNGSWRLSDYDNGWEKVIQTIYFSKDMVLKKDFLQLLNEDIIENILESRRLNSENFDNIAESMNEIISEVCWEYSDEEDFDFINLEEISFYSNFREKKIALLQDYLDNDRSVEDYTSAYCWDGEEETINQEIRLIKDFFEKKVLEMLQNEYKWTDIKISEFDFMSLEINIEEHIRETFESESYADYYHNNWKEMRLESKTPKTETINSILDPELL